MGYGARRNPTSRKAVKKNNRLWESQLRRRAAGTLKEERLSAQRRQSLSAIAKMESTKSAPKVRKVREVPANSILGPKFKGKKLVSEMGFQLPDGKKLNIRLLKASDASGLWDMYYNGMSGQSRGLFASFPIFTGTGTPSQMRARLEEMSVDAFPRGKKMRHINRGKAAGAFNPRYPVNKSEVAKGAKPVLFNPSANYVMTDPATGKVEGFFQLKYLGQTPIFGAALREERQGKGLGVLGTRFRIDVARRLGLKSVRATVNPANFSKKVLEKEGFKVIGSTKVHEGTSNEHVEELMELELK